RRARLDAVHTGCRVTSAGCPDVIHMYAEHIRIVRARIDAATETVLATTTCRARRRRCSQRDASYCPSLHDGDDARLDDALVHGEQREPVAARRCDDHLIERIGMKASPQPRALD